MTWDPFHRRLRKLLRRRNQNAAALGRYATVMLNLDYTKFNEGMRRAARATSRLGFEIAEVKRQVAYQQRIQNELQLCRANVRAALDGLCHALGYDPAVVLRFQPADVAPTEHRDGVA